MVVIADDDPTERELLTEALVLRGFAVISVGDTDALYDLLVAAQEAVGTLGAVVANLHTPGGSLERCAAWVRFHRPSTPFVIVTAQSRVRERWIADRGIPVLCKPFRVERLVRLMRAPIAVDSTVSPR